MAGYFLLKLNNKLYVNDALYITAIAGDKLAFKRMLASKALCGELIFEQPVYPITQAQQVLCEKYEHIVQDIDDTIRHFNIVSKETLKQIKEHVSEAFYDAHTITVDPKLLQFVNYKHMTFFKVRDWEYEESARYRAAYKMAAVRVCGYLYIAVNAVDIRMKDPLIATLKNS